MLIPKYTEVLKNIMDNEQTKPLLDKALSTYPMYVPKNEVTYSIIPTREQLNQKLLNHYKYREIGFETVGRFLDELEITMNEIMPYYYSLFKSADIMNEIEDPFGNVNVEEKTVEKTTTEASNTAKADSSTESETNMNSNNKGISTSTPQGVTTIPAEEIDSIDHADSVSWGKDKSSSDGTTSSKSSSETEGNSNTDRELTYTKKGNQGVNTYAHDMIELRDVFLNIEKMIIEDERVSELFMRVF